MSAADIERRNGPARNAMATVRGQSAAVAVMTRIESGTARPDDLGLAWAALGIDAPAQLGFARAVQKRLELATLRSGTRGGS